MTIRRHAEEEAAATPDLSLQQLDAVLGTFPEIIGRGGDGASPRALLRLPTAARLEYAELLSWARRTLSLPAQGLLNLIILRAKPQGGDRPITLTSGSHRT